MKPVALDVISLRGWLRAGLVVLVLALAQVVLSGVFQAARAASDLATAAQEIASDILKTNGSLNLTRVAEPVPHWRVQDSNGTLVAVIGSTYGIIASTGYSGKPVDLAVAVDAREGRIGHIAAVRLLSHQEPVLTLGLSDADFARFTSQFTGMDLTAPFRPDAIPAARLARATVTSGVIRDAVLRTARVLAGSAGLLPSGGIDRTAYQPMGWAALTDTGAVASARLSLDQARAALADASVPPPAGPGTYIELFTALIDPPSIGQNLLGAHRYQRAMATVGPGEAVLFVGSRGLVGHRGTGWRRSGTFETLTIRQGATSFHPVAEGFEQVEALDAHGAPDLEQISLFRMPAEGFDPTRPFRVDLTIERPAAGGGAVSASVGMDYALPAQWIEAPAQIPPAAWEDAWTRRLPEVVGVTAQLGVLFAILLFQTALVRRRKLFLWVRAGFLTVTFLWLGLWVGGQLSIVQVAAFLQSLLGGFRWETFLIEPVIFTLWGFTALGMLFWGRGVYCGWLCPFGALQELANLGARRLGIRQVAVPHAVHERLWLLKYTLAVGIVGLSFYSMDRALILAEVEPFKTVITMRLMRAWPFLLFVVAILTAGLFIERFYCRYVCPLGAALALPAKLKIFDWLDRRPQCGRECRLCEQNCTVGAIDPLGRINANECINCLRCQMIFNDAQTCVVLKRRARGAIPAAAPAGGS